MGTSSTPTYRVEMSAGPKFHYTPAAWRIAGMGVPKDDNLKRYVETFERSTYPGGGNAHLGVTTIITAKIVNQRTGDIVAFYAVNRISGAPIESLQA